MQKITPCLWFDRNAEEAVAFYTSVFKNSKIKTVTHYGKTGPMPEGTVMTILFELEGQEFVALNGGPEYKFTPAISLWANCDTQEELDRLWERLSEGGEIIECGWLNDKFGMAWQVVPTIMSEIFEAGNAEKIDRTMKALVQMKKLDIDTLKRAYEGD